MANGPYLPLSPINLLDIEVVEAYKSQFGRREFFDGELVSDIISTEEYGRQVYADRKKDFGKQNLQEIRARKVIQSNLINWAPMFPNMRLIAGDGNCLLRAFLFGFLNFHHRYALSHDKLRAVYRLGQFQERYSSHAIIVEPIKLLQMLVENGKIIKTDLLLHVINDHACSDALVYMLRIMIADLLQLPEFKPYITVRHEEFIKKITQMGTWGGDFEFTVLENLFRVSICVSDLLHGVRRTYGAEASNLGVNNVELIFSGNHYDVFDI